MRLIIRKRAMIGISMSILFLTLSACKSKQDVPVDAAMTVSAPTVSAQDVSLNSVSAATIQYDAPEITVVTKPDVSANATQSSNSTSLQYEYCTYSKNIDGSFTIQSTKALNHQTVLAGERISNFVDEINMSLSMNSYDTSLNQSIYYDLLATSFMNATTLTSEFENPNYSIIMAYIAQVYDGVDATLDRTILKVDDTRCEFTYFIGTSIIQMSSDGTLIWDSKPIDVKQKLQALKASMHTSSDVKMATSLLDNASTLNQSAVDPMIQIMESDAYKQCFALLGASNVPYIQTYAKELSLLCHTYGTASSIIGNTIIYNNDSSAYLSLYETDTTIDAYDCNYVKVSSFRKE